MVGIVWETEHEYTRSHNTLRKATRWDRGEPVVFFPPLSLIGDFEKQNTRGNVSKISMSLSVSVSDRSDRNPPIAATSVTF